MSKSVTFILYYSDGDNERVPPGQYTFGNHDPVNGVVSKAVANAAVAAGKAVMDDFIVEGDATPVPSDSPAQPAAAPDVHVTLPDFTDQPIQTDRLGAFQNGLGARVEEKLQIALYEAGFFNGDNLAAVDDCDTIADTVQDLVPDIDDKTAEYIAMRWLVYYALPEESPEGYDLAADLEAGLNAAVYGRLQESGLDTWESLVKPAAYFRLIGLNGVGEKTISYIYRAMEAAAL